MRQEYYFKTAEESAIMTLDAEYKANEELKKVKALTFSQKKKLINLAIAKFKEEHIKFSSLGNLSVSKKFERIFNNYSEEYIAYLSVIGTVQLFYEDCL